MNFIAFYRVKYMRLQQKTSFYLINMKDEISIFSIKQTTETSSSIMFALEKQTYFAPPPMNIFLSTHPSAMWKRAT